MFHYQRNVVFSTCVSNMISSNQPKREVVFHHYTRSILYTLLRNTFLLMNDRPQKIKHATAVAAGDIVMLHTRPSCLKQQSR